MLYIFGGAIIPLVAKTYDKLIQKYGLAIIMNLNIAENRQGKKGKFDNSQYMKSISLFLILFYFIFW